MSSCPERRRTPRRRAVDRLWAGGSSPHCQAARQRDAPCAPRQAGVHGRRVPRRCGARHGRAARLRVAVTTVRTPPVGRGFVAPLAVVLSGRGPRERDELCAALPPGRGPGALIGSPTASRFSSNRSASGSPMQGGFASSASTSTAVGFDVTAGPSRSPRCRVDAQRRLAVHCDFCHVV